MSDPFDALRRRDPEEVPVDRLPAEEVRRRGDTRRRRRTALQGAAATLAVVAVVGGVALGTGVVDRSAPQPPPASQGPSPSPSPTRAADPSPVVDPKVVTAIPADFPLADGYPTDTGADVDRQGPAADVDAFTEMTACDETLERLPHEDRLAATFTQPEDFRGRELTTYASESDASDQLAAIVNLYQGCSRQGFEGGPDTVTTIDLGALGDTSYRITRYSELDGAYPPGMESIVVVQVGNALLLSSEADEGGGTLRAIRQATLRAEGAVVRVAEAMCVFAADGCGDEHTPGLLAQADFEHLTDFRTTWSRSDDGFSSADCRESIPAALLDRGATAEVYEGRSDEGVVNARGITTFTDYPDAGSAADAFTAAAQDLAACGDPVTSVDRGEMTWTMFSSPAPEVCTECGTAWLHAVGVALAGDRVVAVNLSWIGDLELVVGAEDPPPMSAVMGVAAEVAAQEGGGQG